MILQTITYYLFGRSGLTPGLADAGKIRIDPTEWTALRAAIDRMIGECRALQAAI